MDRDLVKVRIPGIIYLVAQVLEILVSICVIAAIIISLWALLLDLGVLVGSGVEVDNLHNYLGAAFSVVIGIEFLKMLSRHNMSSCVEVLLFAVARQMIVEHTTPFENLIMVVSIAVLFAIRKFLFIPELDDKRHRREKTPAGVEHPNP